jgi:hypothetical protein
MKSYFHISYWHHVYLLSTTQKTVLLTLFYCLPLTSRAANSHCNVFPYNATTNADHNNKSHTINPYVYIKTRYKMTLWPTFFFKSHINILIAMFVIKNLEAEITVYVHS